MPMLHGMGDIGGLDDVLENDGGLEIVTFLFADSTRKKPCSISSPCANH
jgi:hypothetical protein